MPKKKLILKKKKKPVLKRKVTLKPSELKIPSMNLLLDPGVTQGLVSTFLFCRMKFMYATNIIRTIKKSLNFFFGSFGHEMLESWYKAKKYNIPSYKGKEFTLDKQYMELGKAKMIAVMENYTRIYKKDSFTSIEFEFDFLDSSKLFRRRGKIDAVTKNGYIVDHKFKGRITPDEISEKLTFDFQMLYYITSYEMLTGKKINGVLYNIIRNPGMKQGKGESLKQLTKRISDDMKQRPEHYFMRFECKFTAQDKAKFNRELLYKVMDMKDVVTGKNYPYKNEGSCTGIFGCEFLKACSSDSLEGYKKETVFYPELEVK